jgi:hypothetical protein
MAYQGKSASLAVLLALLLSLHSAISFSLTPSYPISRIKPVHIALSSPLSAGQYRRRRRQTTVGAVNAPPLDDWEPSNDKFSRLKASPIVTFLHSCYTRYLHLCENRPFLTNSIAAGVLAGVGDMIAQSLQAGSVAAGISSFKWLRWRSFMLTGLFFEGPWMTFWYKCLKRLGLWMETKFQSGPRQQVLGQVLTGQTIGVAIFYPAFFVAYECVGAILSGQGKYECLVYILLLYHSEKELKGCY